MTRPYEFIIFRYSGILLLIGLSFCLYSSRFYPLLNSDDGVTILMIHYFDPRTDLYFWGQDRYGSLLPLLGQVFYRGFGLTGVLSESLSHYLVLICGYFSMASFLKDNKLKIALALAWFFPPFHMLDFLRNTLGLEFSLFCIGFYLLHKVALSTNLTNYGKFASYILALIVLAMSWWVSDTALFSIMLLTVYMFLLRNIRTGKWLQFRLTSETVKYLYVTLIISIATALFIIYAKQISAKSTGYAAFANWEEMFISVQRILSSIRDLLFFKANEPGTSLNCYGVILLLVLLLTRKSTLKIDRKKKLMVSFFIIQASMMLLVVISSGWAYSSETGRRYFVSIYAELWVAVLLILDGLAAVKNPRPKITMAVLFVTLIVGGVGSQYNIRCIWPATAIPTVKQVQAFNKLGRIGIIANYWNSYVISCINPDSIVATPHQGDTPRNAGFTREVFGQPRLLLIRDGWLTQFPDTMQQFGHTLLKTGNEKRIGGCYTCEYTELHSGNH